MRTSSPRSAFRVACAAAMSVTLLMACRPKSPETPPAPVPPAPEVADAIDAPEALPAVDQAPVATVSVGQSAAATAQAGAGSAPPLDQMKLATASSKLGVPVDLRYQFDGAVEEGRPAVLHLAAVPRVEGSNLAVSIKDAPGIEASGATVTAQRASASQAYRQRVSVTRHAGAPTEMRVLVTMDLPEGSAFGYFSVPLGNPESAR